MKVDEPQPELDDNVEIARGGRAGLAQRLRNRRERVASDDDDQGQEEEFDPGKSRPPSHDLDRKLTKKELLKLQKKQEKDRMREAMRQQKEA